MVELTKEELGLLRAISEDKFSVGAFSGMIFNAVHEIPVLNKEDAMKTIDAHIKLALQIRLRMVELTK